MIKTEMLNNNTLIRHYSDEYKVIQVETGYMYDEAVDIYPCPFTYIESEELKEQEELQEDYIEPQEALDIIFGENN